MNDDLEKLVDRAASLSVTARSAATKELARKQRKEAYEKCMEAIAEIGKLISKLNKADELV